MIRIATIDNLSARAFRLLDLFPWGVATLSPPSHVNYATQTARCDASLLPSAGLHDLRHIVEPIGRYGIACTGSVGSVILRTRVPVETLVRREFPIGVTAKSKTSRQLLVKLCELSYGKAPVLVGLQASTHAQLLIGDEAYTARRTGSGEWMDVDLSGWWHDLTGEPFVFARWVVRRELNHQSRDRVETWLDATTAQAASQAGIAKMFAMGPRLFGSVAEATSYYTKLRYRLTPADLASQGRFESMMEDTRCHLSA